MHHWPHLTHCVLVGAWLAGRARGVGGGSSSAAAGATVAVLVVLADILFFSHEPGISLAIFVLALVAGVLALRPAKLRAPRTLLLTAAAVLAALGVVRDPELIAASEK